MKHILLFLLSFFVWGTLPGQTPVRIGGRVSDENKAPLCAVSVILRSLPDSVYVAGTVTDVGGGFSLPAAAGRDYLVSASFLGCRTAHVPCKAGDLLDITLRADGQMMQEVVIRGERPLVKAEGGKLVFDAGSMMQRRVADNVWDLLAKLPGVQVSGSQVTLIGSRKVTLVIDGRPSMLSGEQLRSVLENMPLEKVKQAEVMQEAPARYHTNGAVINIVTLRPKTRIVEGQVTSFYRDKYYAGGGVTGNLRAATPKCSWDISYAPSWDKTFTPSEMYARHRLGDGIRDIRITNRVTRAADNHDLRTAFNWDVSEKSTLGVTYTGSFVPNTDGLSLSTGNFQDSRNRARSEQRLHNATVDYTAPFGLSVGFGYTHYRMDKSQDLDILYHADQRRERLLTRDMQQVDNWQVYADQSHTIARRWTLGYGFSYFHAADHNAQNYGDCDTSRPADDVVTRLKEDKVDFYLSAGSRFRNGISFDLSVKGEYYRIGDYRKWAVYPRVSFSRMKNPDRILQIGLSTDKTYPPYWAMQPSVGYIDGYTEIHGSPDLRPSLCYSFNTTYIFNRRYMLRAFYSYTGDEYKQSPYQSPDRPAFIYKSTNWDYEQKVGLMAVLPFSVGRWFSSQVTLIGLALFDRCDEFFDQSFNRRKALVVFNTDNTFTLRKNLVLELSSHVQSPAIQGTFDIGTVFTMSAGMKWTFFGERMSLSVRCDDLFDTGGNKLRLRHNGQYADVSDCFRHNRVTTLRLTCRFGGYRERRHKAVDTSRFAR